MPRSLKTETRDITNAGHHKVIGQFPSRKTGKMIPWESQIERDFLYLAEHDPQVASIEAQPERIKIHIGAVAHRYTPDYLLRLRDGRLEFKEVKPATALADAGMRARLDAATLQYALRGDRLSIALDTDLRTGYRLANVRTLYRYAWLTLTRAETRQLGEFAERLCPCDLAELIAALATQGMSHVVAYHAMYFGFMSFDIESAPITPITTIQGWQQ